MAYKEDGYNATPYNYENACKWIDKWVNDTVLKGHEQTCEGMVNYLNRFLNKINRRAQEVQATGNLADAVRRAAQTIQEAQNTAQTQNIPVLVAQQAPAEPPEPLAPNPTNMVYATFAPLTTNYITINPANFTQWTTHWNTPTPMPTPPLTQQVRQEMHIGPGEMCEYGWYDAEIERDIAEIMAREPDVRREDAIIRVFNDDGRPRNETTPIRVNLETDTDDEWDYDLPYVPDDDPRDDR